MSVDHGREFYLCLAMQELPRDYRADPTRSPAVQTSSRANLVAERMWPEVNARVSYPVKTAFNILIAADEFDQQVDFDKFCLSWVGQAVTHAGLENFVNAWNSHHVRGRGVPNELMLKNFHTARIPVVVLPLPEDAVQFMRNQVAP